MEDGELHRQRSREYYRRNKTRVVARVADWQRRNPEKVLGHKEAYRLKHRDAIRAANREWMRRAYTNDAERARVYDRKRRAQTRLDVIMAYSGGTMRCVRCGFSDLRALQVDHINGGGQRQRMAFKNKDSFFISLKRLGFPEGYQVLCANCNWIKRAENGEYNAHTSTSTAPMKAGREP